MEFALIDWIRRQAGSHPRVALGIGDDAAALRWDSGADCLVAMDMLVENVHFSIPEATPRLIGRKALAVNLSDIAAMAGRPLAAFVSVAIPRGKGMAFAQEIHAGVLELANRFDVALAGGDTAATDGPLVISVAVIGEPGGRGIVRREGAKAGDWIMATGTFGGSLAGRHLTFEPRVAEAIALHEAVPLHAMIDVSDGLAADLHHILEASGVGAVIGQDAIPVSPDARNLDDGKTPLDHALGDGEDFELLFTVSPEDGKRLVADSPVSVRLAWFGEIVAEPGCRILDASGQSRPLPRAGWVHEL